MGEVHTGLLQHSAAMSPALTRQLLDLAVGQWVRHSDRPIAHTVSPDVFTGVDCALPSANGSRVRAVGTTISRSLITGGHVLQGSAYVEVVRGGAEGRRAWSYYLTKPGRLETIGKVDARHVSCGFLAGASAPDVLNLGAICNRAMEGVQLRPHLDRKAPFRATRTRLRWAVGDDESQPRTLTFAIENETVRTVRLSSQGQPLGSLVALCESLALHDWLLTTLLAVIERSRIGSGSRHDVVARLAPAVDVLLHLWMPTARVADGVADLWESLEHRPGLTRQWQANVARVRDQVALATLAEFAPSRA